MSASLEFAAPDRSVFADAPSIRPPSPHLTSSQVASEFARRPILSAGRPPDVLTHSQVVFLGEDAVQPFLSVPGRLVYPLVRKSPRGRRPSAGHGRRPLDR